jgi:sugar phosphate isomerase/epimerase
MKISLVTDEISADPETAIELGVDWGVHDFELRGFGADRVPNFSAFEKQRIRELLEEFEARIVAISPGLFKIPYPGAKRERFPLRAFDAALYERWQAAQDVFKYHLEELLPASIAYAGEIGAPRIVIFSFERGAAPPEPAPDEVLEALHGAAQLAESAGLQLAIEVEEGFWADTGRRTAELVQAVDHPALGVNWDPGNAYVAGDDPYPAGYEAVRPFVAHVHFKDVRRTVDGDYRYVVDGDIDWAGQVAALHRDGYAGYISIESHMQPKVSSARALLNRLQRSIEATSNEGKE